MDFYSTRVRCTNCGSIFVRDFEKGSLIKEVTEPCANCKTVGNLEVVTDESMTGTDGRQILHG